jgi:hypothetical protein
VTIVAADSVFPDNAIALIAARIPGAVDADLTVLRRPLRPTDPTQAVGVFPLTFVPNEPSIEFTSLQPTLNRYQIVIQTLVKEFDEEAGINIHSILSARLRSMFYRDAPLHVGLTALSVTMNNGLERMQRRGITTQRFLSTEIQRVFQYTSWIEFWLETETVTVP